MDEPTIEERVTAIEERLDMRDRLESRIVRPCVDMEKTVKEQIAQNEASTKAFNEQDDLYEAKRKYAIKKVYTKNAYIQKVRNGEDVPPLAEWDPYIRMLATKPKD